MKPLEKTLKDHKNKLAVGGGGSLAILAVCWQLIYAPLSTDIKEVNKEVTDVKIENATLKTQVNILLSKYYEGR